MLAPLDAGSELGNPLAEGIRWRNSSALPQRWMASQRRRSRCSRSTSSRRQSARRVHQILRRRSGSDRCPSNSRPHCFPIPGWDDYRVEDHPAVPTSFAIQRPVRSSWGSDGSLSSTAVPLSLTKIRFPGFAFTTGMMRDIKCSRNHDNWSGRIRSRNEWEKISSEVCPPSCKTKCWRSEDGTSRTSAKDASRHDFAVAIFSKLDPCRLCDARIMQNVLINCKTLSLPAEQHIY